MFIKHSTSTSTWLKQVLPGLLLVLCFMQTSCVGYKNIVNFRQAPDSLAMKSIPLPPLPEHKIQPDDQLSITIYSINPEAVAPLNLSHGNTTGSETAPAATVGAGFLVDREGNIDMPSLGRIKAAGLTVEELKDTIIQKSLRYVRDPIVNIRFLNFHFTILGEVSGPGTYTIANEKITLLEALGMAGDFTPYGNKENILIVREEAGQQVFERINLLSQDIFTSPYFYLRKNDLIYVEPMQAKTASIADPASKVLPYVSVLVTLTTLIITILR